MTNPSHNTVPDVPDPNDPAPHDLDDWLFGPDDPEGERFMKLADAYVMGGVGMDGVSDEDFRYAFGVSRDEVAEWREGLDSEQAALYDGNLAEHRALSDSREGYLAKVRAGLEQSAPNLLLGRLPDDQAQLLGAERYILGSNQSACFDVDEAQAYLKEHGGVNNTDYALNHRFLFFDDQTNDVFIDKAVVSGYAGESGGGKFIVAIPNDGSFTESIETVPDALLGAGKLPVDLITGVNGLSVVNAKYIAAYIDVDGSYIRNQGFMQSDQPALAVPTPEESGDWL